MGELKKPGFKAEDVLGPQERAVLARASNIPGVRVPLTIEEQQAAGYRLSGTEPRYPAAGIYADRAFASLGEGRTLTTEEDLREAIAEERTEAKVIEWLLEVGVGARLARLEIDPELLPPEWVAWVADWQDGASMLIAGNYGSGKTAAAVWCLRQVYDHGARWKPREGGGCRDFSWRPARCFFTKARELYAAVFQGHRHILERARNSRVLVIDDWGAVYQHEWPLHEMDGIIDTRWERNLATIITTNVHPTKGENSIGATAPRTLDRMCDDPGPGLVIMDRVSQRAGHRPKAEGES